MNITRILPGTQNLSATEAAILTGGWVVSCVVVLFVAITSAWSPVAFIAIPAIAWVVTYVAMLMIVAAMSAGMIALAFVPVMLVCVVGYYGVFVALPAAAGLVVAGPGSVIALLTGDAARATASKVIMAAGLGLFTGFIVGILQAITRLKDKKAETLLKSLLSKKFWTGEEGAWQEVALSATVGLIVGALGGAAGIFAGFATTDSSGEAFRVLSLVIPGGGGAGGDFWTVLGAILLLALALLLHGLLVGLLAGGAVGAALGAIKGSMYGAMKVITTYGTTRERSPIGPAMTTGFANGAVTGCIIGMLNALIAGISAALQSRAAI